ncbi:MAG TPA: DEAD/DEAH box helicase [Candidatus Baltobacteraceae bacterium]|nr:DEAD/DEAH box helicase [Candidatus Baltobacteraceae bacterium]
MSDLAIWRSRLPVAIASWFSRDLVARSLPFLESGLVELRVVEATRIEASVQGRSRVDVAIEWVGGSGPLGLRPVCTCGENGICPHAIATLETVRLRTDPQQTLETSDAFAWLPNGGSLEAPRTRSIWPVLFHDGERIWGVLVLDSPRLRGVVRDASAIAGMMDATSPTEWSEYDRALVRDDLVRAAFASRASGVALARAALAMTDHPRLCIDDQSLPDRHPSELPLLRVDRRGLRLRAVRRGRHFFPMLEDADGNRITPSDLLVLEGPPTWLLWKTTLYLHNGSFDVRAVRDAQLSNDLDTLDDQLPSTVEIARVAAYLLDDERVALGIVDAIQTSFELSCRWSAGVLVAAPFFIDRVTNARGPFDSNGMIVAHDNSLVRFSAESAAVLRTRLLSAGFVPREGGLFVIDGASRTLHFLQEILPSWNDLDVHLDDRLRAFADGGSRLEIGVRARRSNDSEDWFELELDIFVDGERQTLSPREIAAILGSGERYLEIGGRPCDAGALEKHRALALEVTERRRASLAGLLALRDELGTLTRADLPEEVQELRERMRSFAGIDEVAVPPLATGTLREYQRRGLDFLAFLSQLKFGGILADDMGLGKTLQLIAHLAWRKAHQGSIPSLVIAPTSVTHAWESEIARFAPQLRTVRLQSGADRARQYADLAEIDVVITSYALARLDVEALSQISFRTLVLDEAQQAKNPDSQIARALRRLQADHRVALTGTPVENSLRDLWSIFSFVEPALLGRESEFRRRFEVPISQGDTRAMSSLRSRLEPFVLRRTKEDVAPELPERTEVELECELSDVQRRLYRGVVEAARKEVFEALDRGGAERTQIHVLAALTRLRQICAHPGLVVPEYRDEPMSSSKFVTFMETVAEIIAGGHRVVVFSAFASMLEIIRKQLAADGVEVALLDGATRDRKRKSEIDRFSANDGPPVFLCTLKAGGVGLTLTAADYVIIYDPWWNPAAERQAIDRAHRIGQMRNVTAYRLVTAGTVEQKIRTLAARKRELADDVLELAPMKALGRDDLEALLADPD